MAIASVTIEDTCTACALCEQICPEVFVMNDIAKVIDGADLNAVEDKVKEAVDSCPVSCIKVS